MDLSPITYRQLFQTKAGIRPFKDTQLRSAITLLNLAQRSQLTVRMSSVCSPLFTCFVHLWATLVKKKKGVLLTTKNLCLTTMQTNQDFARNVQKGAKADLKRQLCTPVLFIFPLFFSSPEHSEHGIYSWEKVELQIRIVLGTSRSLSSVAMLLRGNQPGLLDPQADQGLQAKKDSTEHVILFYWIHWKVIKH